MSETLEEQTKKMANNFLTNLHIMIRDSDESAIEKNKQFLTAASAIMIAAIISCLKQEGLDEFLDRMKNTARSAYSIGGVN